ncbi:hypothetical protein [Pseudonocardia acaciae]|uniref:hypothetical protein n=1 Tax=Pseudonocardia acaciae TaxID=551276 RepID=UPI00048F6702|nr:hypothetical protein [Pseudonocardia acaciae]
MRPFWFSPALVVAGGVAVALLAGGSAAAPPLVPSAAPPVALASVSDVSVPASGGHGRAPQPPAPAPVPKSTPVEGHDLGGINLKGYCNYTGYDDVKLIANNPYGWVCFNNGDDHMTSLTVNDACQWQGEWGDVGVPPANGDPNLWRCWSVG